MSSEGQSWGHLRPILRRLENETQEKLNVLTQYASVKLLQEPTKDENYAKAAAEALLKQRESHIEQLEQAILRSQSTPLRQAQLSSHKTSLKTDQQAVERALSAINSQRAKNSRLQQSARHGLAGPMTEEQRYLLEQEESVSRSTGMTGQLLDGIERDHEDLQRQNRILSMVQTRSTHALSHFPGMRELMSKVTARKHRDGVILGTFMAACFLFFFFIS